MEKLAVLCEKVKGAERRGGGWKKSIEIHLMKKLDKVAWEGEKSESAESNLLSVAAELWEISTHSTTQASNYPIYPLTYN